jgi:co-chaperonin GroES (HSP10)
MIEFRLLGKKLVIDVDKKDIARTAAGLYIASEEVTIKDKNIGTVTQVGFECVRKIITADGTIKPFEIGDRVTFLAHQGTTFTFEEEKYVVFDEDFIFGMVYE